MRRPKMQVARVARAPRPRTLVGEAVPPHLWWIAGCPVLVPPGFRTDRAGDVHGIIVL